MDPLGEMHSVRNSQRHEVAEYFEKTRLAYIQFYLFTICYWHFTTCPPASQTFKGQLNSYLLLRWSGEHRYGQQRFPSPFRGHDPRQQCPKERSEILQGPKVTSCKELWESMEERAPAGGIGQC